MAYKIWTGGPEGDWSTGSNWSGGVTPQGGDISIGYEGRLILTNIGIVDQLIWLNYPRMTSQTSVLDLRLDGSSIGPTSVVITNGDANPVSIHAHNSALQGQIFAGSGSAEIGVDYDTSAVNSGWIGVASSTPNDSLSVYSGGNFANTGVIQAGINGAFSLLFGMGGQSIGNWGIIQADPGGKVGVYGFNENTFVNFGAVKVEGGTAQFYTNLLQSDAGVISVKGGGTALITGAADGGTIQIEKGMVDLGDRMWLTASEQWGPTPEHSREFHSDVEFTGTDGSIAFGSENIKMAFDEAKNEILITTLWQRAEVTVATVNLGNNRDYIASQFSVSGDTLTFHSDTVG